MTTAADLRSRIEATLSNRVPAAFSLKIKCSPELFPTSIAEVDAILEGGIPRGSITEVSGADSTGRTSFALSILSGITQSGAVCAWVDVHDSLSPQSAAATGIILDKLLWLRIAACKTEQQIVEPANLNRVPVSSAPRYSAMSYGRASTHPRNETLGMDNAVSLLFKNEGALLQDQSATAPERSLNESRRAEPQAYLQRNEQLAYDRLPARRGEYFLKKIKENKQVKLQSQTCTPSERKRSSSEIPWSRLEQSLKATDLLLQTGGFSAIVLDMSDVLPQEVMRIPLTSWYRFRLAAEQTRTALILLTQSLCTGSCAALTLHCESSTTEAWSTSDEIPLFQNQNYTLIRERNRNDSSLIAMKKTPARAMWQTQTEWARAR